jgi:hypothetical protein
MLLLTTTNNIEEEKRHLLKSNTSSFDSQVSRLKIKTDIQQLRIAVQHGAGLSPWEVALAPRLRLTAGPQ